MNLQSMKAWMNALGVPIQYIGNHHYIEAINFTIAMRAACRIGQRAFLVPGCRPLARGIPVEGSTRELDPLYVQDTLKKCMAEMLLSRRWDDKAQGLKLKAQIQALIDVAHESLQNIPNQVKKARARADFKNLAEFDKKGFDIDIHELARQSGLAEGSGSSQPQRASSS